MPHHSLFQGYLDKVCQEIRWKKAHAIVCREMGDHLEDGQAALMEAGLTEDEAARDAVLEMGDAELIGSQLDRVYRPRPAWRIIALTSVLMLLGCCTRLYVSYAKGMYAFYPPRDIFWLCAAVVMLIAGYFVDYTIVVKHPIIIGVGFVAVRLLMLYYSFGAGIWYIYNYTYLASLIPVIFAGILWWWPYKSYAGLLGCYLTLVSIVFLWLEPAIAASATLFTLLCGGIGVAMLTAELLKGKFGAKKTLGLFTIFTPLALMAAWKLSFASVREEIAYRLSIMLNPYLEPAGLGYAGTQIRAIIDNAKWFGSGGHIADFMPDATSSFMLMFYLQKFGWIAFAAILLLFGLLFVFSGVQIIKLKSKIGRMVASAIFFGLLARSIAYIVGNVATGFVGLMGLPLFSFGNMSLITDAFLIGLMLSVFRIDDVVRDAEVARRRTMRIVFEEAPRAKLPVD